MVSQQLVQDVDQTVNSQKTFHILSSRVGYGVSFEYYGEKSLHYRELELYK